MHDRASPPTRTEAVMADIRGRIASRRLAPGAKLPSVRDFAAGAGVSKSTVVEAYDRLVAEGAIASRRGSGFFVAGTTRPLTIRSLRPDLDRANDEILVLAMIETREALANLDAIVATPGLDGVYVGPNDLAIELGHAPKSEHDHPDVTRAVDHVRATTTARGLLVGIFCSNGGAAQMRLRQGFHLVTPGNDAAVFRAAYAEHVRQARPPAHPT